MDEPGGCSLMGIKLVTKGEILHDSSYMRYLKKSNSQKKEVESWLPGTERWGK